MIHLDNIIKVMISDTKYRTRYKTTCDDCGKDRGYLTKQNAVNNPRCPKCSHQNISDKTKEKMSAAKIGSIPWNKGKVGVSDATSVKMRDKKLGKIANNKGKTLSIDTRIKLSCANRGIATSDFDDFLTEEAKRERNRFTDMNMHIKCFEQYQYRCDVCRLDRVVLNAHHKNGWRHFPEQRFELANLVALCTVCHRNFHNVYGNGKASANTEQQYQQFKLNRVDGSTRKRIILVVGAPGAGKSWVCDQLSHMIHYHKYDDNRKIDIRAALWNAAADTIIYDPYSHVSTFISRNSDIFDIQLYVIRESMDTIKQRLLSRGGAYSSSVGKRISRMKNLASGATYSGTSDEVLKELLSKITTQ